MSTKFAVKPLPSGRGCQYLAKIAQQKHVSMNKILDMIVDAGIRNVYNQKN